MFPCGQRYDIYGRQLRNSYGKLLNSPYQTVFEKGKKKLDKKEKENKNKNKQKTQNKPAIIPDNTIIYKNYTFVVNLKWGAESFCKL